MARAWSNSYASAPGTLTPCDARHFDSYTSPVTDTFTIPTTPYTMVLDYRPKRGALAVTIAGAAATLVEYGATPTAGQVAVNYIDGRVVFASGDAGKTAVATYQHWGTVVDAGLFNSMQKVVAAAGDQRVVLSGFWFGEVSTTGEHYLTAPGAGTDTWTIARVAVYTADASNATGMTTFAAHTSRTAGAATATLERAQTYTAGGAGTLTNTVAGAASIVVWCSLFGGHQNVGYTVELVRS